MSVQVVDLDDIPASGKLRTPRYALCRSGADHGIDREPPELRVEDLEIMLHCVALPWDTKTGSPPGAGRVRAAAGWGLCGVRAGGGRGGRCTVEVTCRPSSSLVLGPFEAVI